MCIPTKFPVKSLAYQAMCSRLKKLETAGEGVTRSSVLDMRRLLNIVNEVLEVESYPDDDQLPFLEEQPRVDLACSSCGGEIFRTVFSCRNGCLTDGETGALDGTKVTVCPLCFVEGRTCSCRRMQPLRVREMGPLMEIRDKACTLIRDNIEKFFLSEDESDPVDAYLIFTAGLVLYQRSSSKTVGRKYLFLDTN